MGEFKLRIRELLVQHFLRKVQSIRTQVFRSISHLIKLLLPLNFPAQIHHGAVNLKLSIMCFARAVLWCGLAFDSQSKTLRDTKFVSTFDSLDRTLKCDHSLESC